MMDDSSRAKAQTNFGVNKQELIQVVEAYRQRKYVEDIEYIQDTLKGVPELMNSLKVDMQFGIKSSDLDQRDFVFGSNYKAPLERTPFCQLLLAALDDFMLKILIVCAFFSIGVDMGFATPEERSHAWIEGFAILVAVAVVSLVGAGSDYKKEGQFLKQHNLEEMTKTVSIRRFQNFIFFEKFECLKLIYFYFRLPSRERVNKRLSTRTTSESETLSRLKTE